MLEVRLLGKFEINHDGEPIATTSLNLAWVSIHQGNYQRAKEFLEESLELYQEYGGTANMMYSLTGSQAFWE